MWKGNEHLGDESSQIRLVVCWGRKDVWRRHFHTISDESLYHFSVSKEMFCAKTELTKQKVREKATKYRQKGPGVSYMSHVIQRFYSCFRFKLVIRAENDATHYFNQIIWVQLHRMRNRSPPFNPKHHLHLFRMPISQKNERDSDPKHFEKTEKWSRHISMRKWRDS